MRQIFNFQKIIILLVCGLFLVGCAAPQPAEPTSTPVPAPTATATPAPLAEGQIFFEKPDGRRFVGTIHGHGETAIILGNMSRGGEAQWDPFINAVDLDKFTVVTYLRLESSDDGITEDTNIILKTLKDSGHDRVICIGASLGTLPCLSIASQPEVVGMALIAGTTLNPNHPEIRLGETILDTTYPKLFIVGEGDPLASQVQTAYEAASDTKSLTVFPGEGLHGTDIFNSSKHGDEFLKLLVDFVNGLS